MKPKFWLIIGAILVITYGIDLATDLFGERKVSIKNVIFFVFGLFTFLVFWLDLRKKKTEDSSSGE